MVDLISENAVLERSNLPYFLDLSCLTLMLIHADWSAQMRTFYILAENMIVPEPLRLLLSNTSTGIVILIQSTED